MKTTFRTDSYVRTHGYTPRGFGSWAFDVTLSDGCGGYSSCDTMFITGTLTEAKKAVKTRALAEARNVGRCQEILIDVLG